MTPTLIPPGKEIWFINLVLNVIYCIIFYFTAKGQLPFGKGLLQGFCVWTVASNEEKDEGRPADCLYLNSHLLAWREDLAMSIIVVLLFIWNLHKYGFVLQNALMFVSMFVAIYYHGRLHYSYAMDFNPPCIYPVGDGNTTLAGDVQYFLYTFLLCIMIFGFGFNYLSLKAKLLLAAASALVATYLTVTIAPEWSLSVLFAISQTLSSIMGTYGDTDTFTSVAGGFFLVCTLSGFLELCGCEWWEKANLGHFWYDLTLGLTMIVTLITMPKPSTKTKKKTE
mmetsp:Transcript_18572/g.43022  ORF Transcript_18572/g.43022 Transcript_18572/m.43022 type:complete len:281 (+) Transcript_18572:1213-2055(+)|eukprot:CAMPEP_0116869602 /NCGR_PEP_ID=MMETSP0418-20121206/27848_1 /TAXON_ID=1158023 /ORGANISM="Astrosyne radiata, Strain 13vi08-1A" /LENGTH=280 /DNA_ID=CAMNT_0004505711 /DNA_START=908 /DNA_END=1750 /DNA_ORIENTATION=-